MFKKYFFFSLLGFGFWVLSFSIPAHAANISANDFTLVWSANTYIPPDYPCKALPTYDSAVKVDIVPLTKAGQSASGLTFRWYLDNDFRDGASGENRASYTFRTSAIAGSRQYVDVKILDKDENELFILSTSVPVIAPEIALSPAGDASTTSVVSDLPSAALSPGQDETFTASPFFFNAGSALELNYQWSFNGETINKTQEKNKFSVKAAEGELIKSFTKKLSVLVINPFNDIQRATGNIEIIFKK